MYNTAYYALSNTPYAPYNYNNPSAVNVLVDTDDRWSQVVNMPFNFCFYGNVYNQLVIGSNEVVSFNTAYAGAYCPWSIGVGFPTANMAGTPFTNIIAAPFHDMDPSISFDAARTK